MARWPALRGLTLWCSSAETLEALTTSALTGLKRLDVFLVVEEWSVPGISASLAGSITEIGLAAGRASVAGGIRLPHQIDSYLELHMVHACSQLQVLRLSHVTVEDLGPLSVCSHLRELRAVDCFGIHDLSPLQACTQLSVVEISGSLVEDLGPISSCPLVTLNVNGACVRDLSPLRACTRLQKLCAGGRPMLRSLDALEACSELRELDLHGTCVSSLTALAGCSELRVLCLSNCQAFINLETLSSVSHQLQNLQIDRCRLGDLDSELCEDIAGALHVLAVAAGGSPEARAAFEAANAVQRLGDMFKVIRRKRRAQRVAEMLFETLEALGATPAWEPAQHAHTSPTIEQAIDDMIGDCSTSDSENY
ncbi:hypothetical protein FOA52_000052 [Chlamydomonas sp. UWO 241]|nr:hypothetical protein FOA52_000052 [Chlamydomonas sp. UWO 241]